MFIKETSIRYLLTGTISPENNAILHNFIDPKNKNYFFSIWLGALIALRLGDFVAFKYHMGTLGIHWESKDEENWLKGLQLFFNLDLRQRECNKEIPLNTGLRIPLQAACHQLAKIQFITQIAASGNRELLFALIKNGLLDPSKFTDEYDNTILHILAAHGHLDLLLEIQQIFHLPLQKNLYNATPLHHLMLSGDSKQITRALDNHLLEDFNPIIWSQNGFMQDQDRFGFSYAFYLAQSGNFALLKSMIDKKFIDPFIKTATGITLWHALALSAKPQPLMDAKHYLKEKFNLDLNRIQDYKGYTVWHSLAESGNLKGFYALARQGEFDLEDLMFGTSFIHAAALGGNIDDLEERHRIELVKIQNILVERWHGGVALDANLEYEDAEQIEDSYQSEDEGQATNKKLIPREYWQVKINEFCEGLYRNKKLHGMDLSFFCIFTNLLLKTPGFSPESIEFDEIEQAKALSLRDELEAEEIARAIELSMQDIPQQTDENSEDEELALALRMSTQPLKIQEKLNKGKEKIDEEEDIDEPSEMDMFELFNQVLYFNFFQGPELSLELVDTILKKAHPKEMLHARRVGRFFNKTILSMYDKLETSDNELLQSLLKSLDIPEAKKLAQNPIASYRAVAAKLAAKGKSQIVEELHMASKIEELTLLGRNFPSLISHFTISDCYLFGERDKERDKFLLLLCKEHPNRITVLRYVIPKYNFLFRSNLTQIPNLTPREIELFIESTDISILIKYVMDNRGLILSDFPWIQRIYAKLKASDDISIEDKIPLREFLIKVAQFDTSEIINIYEKYHEIFYISTRKNEIDELIKSISIENIPRIRLEISKRAKVIYSNRSQKDMTSAMGLILLLNELDILSEFQENPTLSKINERANKERKLADNVITAITGGNPHDINRRHRQAIFDFLKKSVLSTTSEPTIVKYTN